MSETLEAGRELDALVAEKVMGLCDHVLVDNEAEALAQARFQARLDWEADYGQPPPEKWEPSFYGDDYYRRCTKCGQTWVIGGNSCGPGRSGWLRPYSVDMAAAWEVVRALDQRGKAFSIERRRRDSLSENVPATWLANFWAPLGVGESESAPHAICLAALRAVGGVRGPAQP